MLLAQTIRIEIDGMGPLLMTFAGIGFSLAGAVTFAAFTISENIRNGLRDHAERMKKQ